VAMPFLTNSLWVCDSKLQLASHTADFGLLIFSRISQLPNFPTPRPCLRPARALCDASLCLEMMAENVWPLKLAFHIPICVAMPMHGSQLKSMLQHIPAGAVVPAFPLSQILNPLWWSHSIKQLCNFAMLALY
jgi:hypothetical protein